MVASMDRLYKLPANTALSEVRLAVSVHVLWLRSTTTPHVQGCDAWRFINVLPSRHSLVPSKRIEAELAQQVRSACVSCAKLRILNRHSDCSNCKPSSPCRAG